MAQESHSAHPAAWTTLGHFGSSSYHLSLLSIRNAGYQLGVLNTPLADVASDLGFHVETHGAAVVSALLLGGVFGALAAGVAADAVGPKRAMMLNNLLLAAGCAASFWSLGGFIGLFTARVVTGLAVRHFHKCCADVNAHKCQSLLPAQPVHYGVLA